MKVEKKGTVAVVENISERGGKSRSLEVRNGGRNPRKTMNELAWECEGESSSKSPRAGKPRRQPRGARGGEKSSRRRMPGKKPRQ